MLKKKNRIISRVKSHYWRTSHKFIIALPHSIEEAYDMYEDNGNTFWLYFIEKELKKIQGMETFEMMEGVKPEDTRSQKHPIPGYKEIVYHIIFYINIYGKFTPKARLESNGHETEYIAKCGTYSSVVSKDSVRIAFLYTALKDLDILSCNISNAYLEAPCGEKLWTVGGKEFGSLAGAPIRINQSFYGIKSTGNSCHKALSTTLASMNFEPRRAEPDIWLRMSTNLREEKYWGCIVIYIEDLLVISEDLKTIMDYFSMYNLKDTVIPLY